MTRKINNLGRSMRMKAVIAVMVVGVMVLGAFGAMSAGSEIAGFEKEDVNAETRAETRDPIITGSLEGSQIFEDSFEDGFADGWNTINGTSSVKSGTLTGAGNYILELDPFDTADSDWAKIVHQGNTSWRNYEFSAYGEIVSSDSSGYGYLDFFFYSQSDTNLDNTYWLRMMKVQSKIELYSVGGTGLLQTVPYTVNQGQVYHVNISINQGNIKVYVDGAKEIDVNDTTYGSGTIGLGTSDSGPANGVVVQFDDVKVSSTLLNVTSDSPTYLPGDQVTLTATYTGANATNVTFEVDKPDGTPMVVQTENLKEKIVMENKLPYPLSSFSAVFDGQYAYIFGGSNTTDTSGYSNKILQLDPTTGVSTIMSSTLPYNLVATSAIWNGTHAFIFGGSYGSMQYVDAIYRYDPVTDNLTTMTAKLPSVRAATSAVWDGQYAYIFGGANGASSFDTVLRYDPSTDNLITMNATFSLPRHSTSAVFDGQDIYIFGGNSYSSSESIDEIVRYNIATDSLLTMNATLPTYRSNTVSTWSSGVAYIFGGANKSSGDLYDDILKYIPGTDSIEDLNTSLPTTQTVGYAVWAGSNAYLLGGGNNTTLLDDILNFLPSGTATLTFILPSDALSGTYTVYATTSDALATTTFEVITDSTPPTIDSPPDISYPFGATGNVITWAPRDGNNSDYNITKDGVSVESNLWDGDNITINVDGLDVGEYNYTLWVNDTFGNFAMDSVKVTVYLPHLTILTIDISVAVSPGGTVDFNISIENTFALGKDFLLVVQVMDSENVPLLPVFEQKNINASVATDYTMSVQIPADAPTGTYSVQVQILTDLPRNGGYALDYVNDNFTVS